MLLFIQFVVLNSTFGGLTGSLQKNINSQIS